MLRKGQKELVETYRKGYCGVPAIPGGGKTYALTQWAVEVLVSGANLPGKILIVTYMNSAANNFKQRIGLELENRGITSRDYFVSTIHSLCLQIIKEKPDLVGINSEVNVIETFQKDAIIKDVVEAWKRDEDHKQLYMYYLDDISLKKNGYDKISKKWDDSFSKLMGTAISNFKTNEISPKEAIKRVKKLPDVSLLKVAASIYLEYDKRLKRRGFIDFEDMLSKSKYILTHDSAILKKYKKKYTFVCEDEAQDSNKLQTEILSLIAGKDGNFLRVGDSNQAITATFANSDMRLFKDFCSGKNVKIFNITQSSRSSKQVIDTANRFVKYVRESHPTEECRESLLPQYIEMVGEDDAFPTPIVDGDAIFYAKFTSKSNENEAIVDKCEKLLEEYPDKTTAVLLPSAYKVGEVIKLLDARKIPYEYLDNSSPERNLTLLKLGRIIDFISAPENNEKLIEVVKIFIDEETPFREELLEHLKYINTEEFFYPISGRVDESGISNDIKESISYKIFLALVEKLKDFLDFPFTVPEKLVLYIAEKLDFSREEIAIAQKVASGIKFLMEENARYKLSDLAFELLKTKNSFNYFANLVWELKGYEAKKGVITIATYHKSKGLEWDNVMLGDLNSEDFPTSLKGKFKDDIDYLKSECKNPSAMMKKDLAIILGEDTNCDFEKEAKIEVISERARLLYVGITRAKERLFISGTDSGRTKISEYFNVLSKK
jgi:DNA helicase-2/ATP-dependent DNA helicase PcrA